MKFFQFLLLVCIRKPTAGTAPRSSFAPWAVPHKKREGITVLSPPFRDRHRDRMDRQTACLAMRLPSRREVPGTVRQRDSNLLCVSWLHLFHCKHSMRSNPSIPDLP